MANSTHGTEGRNSIAPSPRTPGSLGYNDAADPNARICRPGDSEGPLGTGGDAGSFMPPPYGPDRSAIPLLVFNLFGVAKFLRAVALMKAQARFTKLQWETYKDDKALNFIYTVMWWKDPPGTAVVVQGGRQEVFAAADQDADHLLDVFLEKCTHGAGSAVTFLEQQEKIRVNSLEQQHQTFKDAGAINQEVAETSRDAVVFLARVKLTAELSGIVLSLLAGAGAVAAPATVARMGSVGMNVARTGAAARAENLGSFLVAMGYSVAKDLATGKTAQAVAITIVTEAGKEAGKHGFKDGGAAAYDKLVPPEVQKFDPGQAAERVAQKKELIAKYEQKVADAVKKGRPISGKTKSYATKAALRQAESAALQKAASPARQMLGKSAKAIGESMKFLFAAWEVKSSVCDYLDAVKDQ